MSPNGPPKQKELFRIVNHDGHRRIEPNTTGSRTHETRREAFRGQRTQELLDAVSWKTLTNKQTAVLRAIQRARTIDGASDREIAEVTGLRINTIPGTRARLVQMGHVVPCRVRACRIGGRNVQTWRAA